MKASSEMLSFSLNDKAFHFHLIIKNCKLREKRKNKETMCEDRLLICQRIRKRQVISSSCFLQQTRGMWSRNDWKGRKSKRNILLHMFLSWKKWQKSLFHESTTLLSKSPSPLSVVFHRFNVYLFSPEAWMHNSLARILFTLLRHWVSNVSTCVIKSNVSTNWTQLSKPVSRKLSLFKSGGIQSINFYLFSTSCFVSVWWNNYWGKRWTIMAK